MHTQWHEMAFYVLMCHYETTHSLTEIHHKKNQFITWWLKHTDNSRLSLVGQWQTDVSAIKLLRRIGVIDQIHYSDLIDGNFDYNALGSVCNIIFFSLLSDKR